jgi:hypothetical protein
LNASHSNRTFAKLQPELTESQRQLVLDQLPDDQVNCRPLLDPIVGELPRSLVHGAAGDRGARSRDALGGGPGHAVDCEARSPLIAANGGGCPSFVTTVERNGKETARSEHELEASSVNRNLE